MMDQKKKRALYAIMRKNMHLTLRNQDVIRAEIWNLIIYGGLTVLAECVGWCVLKSGVPRVCCLCYLTSSRQSLTLIDHTRSCWEPWPTPSATTPLRSSHQSR